MISGIPAFDRQAQLRTLFALVAAGRSGLEAIEKPDRGHQWRARPVAVVAVADRGGRYRQQRRSPVFELSKGTPWLARSYAVTSDAVLRRPAPFGGPPGKAGTDELVDSGDPLFSLEQAAQAAGEEEPVKLADTGATVTTRGLPLKRRSSPKLEGVDSAELAMLPRLPDTAEELKSIALALQADPSKVLKLGKDANEAVVKTMDLSGFKCHWPCSPRAFLCRANSMG